MYTYHIFFIHSSITEYLIQQSLGCFHFLAIMNNAAVNLEVHISSVQSLSHVWLFVTPWFAAYQASLSITNFQSLLKLISIELVMPSNHLILCRPLLLPPSIFLSIRVFSNESVLHISIEVSASASVLPINIQDWVSEKHIFLLFWLCQSLWLCGSQ